MLSRVADSLYWMSRYMERTDSIMRMLKTNYASSQDNIQEFTWRPVLKIFTYLDDDGIGRMQDDTRVVLQYMVADKENPNSVYNMVVRSRENARSVQDHITKELWQCLNEFYHLIKEDKLSIMLQYDDPVTTLDILIRQSMLYYGTSESTMFRGDGFSFMNLGRYLERAIQAVDILDVRFSDLSYDMEKTADVMYWKHLLLSVSGYALYLKTYRSAFEARNIVNQIIFNTHFPRSVLYSLNALQRYFDRLQNDLNTEGYRAINFRIGKLRSKIQYSNLQHVSEVGLHNFLSSLNHDLQDIGNALNQYYFAYS
ncbi:alpha-E domain-containing protein [Fulvivirgaceae bacterium PWU4]|uniref:Alpha-E domain-containing protein n=1 Tax=Chryseosolibacter histidini TaxID=2782349 RepID=A0AAP2DMR9_9BACT|nr:alpha-E domain-containing protein [Chryseosolibacter histidini]MBT1698329.1 alpha-E domain-containing protein [Chryseosolibacter histidini]